MHQIETNAQKMHKKYIPGRSQRLVVWIGQFTAVMAIQIASAVAFMINAQLDIFANHMVLHDAPA